MAKKPYDDSFTGWQFDSRIEHPGAVYLTEPFQFFIDLRVYLERQEPEGGKTTALVQDPFKNSVEITRWDDASWLHFKTRYVELANQVWDKSFLLTPPKGYDEFNWPHPKGPTRDLLCRFNLTLSAAPAAAHVSIPVVRAKKVQTLPNRSYRSYKDHYDADIVDLMDFNYKGTNIHRNGAAHEVGHILGNFHINNFDPHCKTGDDDVCYGTTLAQVMDVMGKGTKLSVTDAKPWQDRIALHTETSSESWTAKLVPPGDLPGVQK